MAAERGKRSKDGKLDFLSSRFDPLRALYTPELQPPVPNIQIFNNLAEYARVIKEGRAKPTPTPRAGNAADFTKLLPSRTKNLKPEEKKKTEARVNALQKKLKLMAEAGLMRSAENAGLVDARRSSRLEQLRKKAKELVREDEEKQAKKKRVNVLDKMEGCQDGPFSVLYTCLKERRRVKVWTRRFKGLRSVLAGYLVAFDKHMNMALTDVDEVYTIEEKVPKDENKAKEKAKRKKKRWENKALRNSENANPSISECATGNAFEEPNKCKDDRQVGGEAGTESCSRAQSRDLCSDQVAETCDDAISEGSRNMRSSGDQSLLNREGAGLVKDSGDKASREREGMESAQSEKEGKNEKQSRDSTGSEVGLVRDALSSELILDRKEVRSWEDLSANRQSHDNTDIGRGDPVEDTLSVEQSREGTAGNDCKKTARTVSSSLLRGTKQTRENNETETEKESLANRTKSRDPRQNIERVRIEVNTKSRDSHGMSCDYKDLEGLGYGKDTGSGEQSHNQCSTGCREDQKSRQDARDVKYSKTVEPVEKGSHSEAAEGSTAGGKQLPGEEEDGLAHLTSETNERVNSVMADTSSILADNVIQKPVISDSAVEVVCERSTIPTEFVAEKLALDETGRLSLSDNVVSTEEESMSEKFWPKKQKEDMQTTKEQVAGHKQEGNTLEEEPSSEVMSLCQEGKEDEATSEDEAAVGGKFWHEKQTEELQTTKEQVAVHKQEGEKLEEKANVEIISLRQTETEDEGKIASSEDEARDGKSCGKQKGNDSGEEEYIRGDEVASIKFKGRVEEREEGRMKEDEVVSGNPTGRVEGKTKGGTNEDELTNIKVIESKEEGLPSAEVTADVTSLEREEGELSSSEDEAENVKSLTREEGGTRGATKLKPFDTEKGDATSIENELVKGQSPREEKEEGELSSSDSDQDLDSKSAGVTDRRSTADRRVFKTSTREIDSGGPLRPQRHDPVVDAGKEKGGRTKLRTKSQASHDKKTSDSRRGLGTSSVAFGKLENIGRVSSRVGGRKDLDLSRGSEGRRRDTHGKVTKTKEGQSDKLEGRDRVKRDSDLKTEKNLSKNKGSRQSTVRLQRDESRRSSVVERSSSSQDNNEKYRPSVKKNEISQPHMASHEQSKGHETSTHAKGSLVSSRGSEKTNSVKTDKVKSTRDLVSKTREHADKTRDKASKLREQGDRASETRSAAGGIRRERTGSTGGEASKTHDKTTIRCDKISETREQVSRSDGEASKIGDKAGETHDQARTRGKVSKAGKGDETNKTREQTSTTCGEVSKISDQSGRASVTRTRERTGSTSSKSSKTHDEATIACDRITETRIKARGTREQASRSDSEALDKARGTREQVSRSDGEARVKACRTREQASRSDGEARYKARGTREQASRSDGEARVKIHGTREQVSRSDSETRGKARGTREKASRSDSEALDKARGTREQVSKSDGETRVKARGACEQVSRLDGEARDKARGTREQVSRSDGEARDKARGTREQVSRSDGEVRDKARGVREPTNRSGGEARDKAREIREQANRSDSKARDKARGTREQASRSDSEARDKARETREQAGRSDGEARDKVRGIRDHKSRGTREQASRSDGELCGKARGIRDQANRSDSEAREKARGRREQTNRLDGEARDKAGGTYDQPRTRGKVSREGNNTRDPPTRTCETRDQARTCGTSNGSGEEKKEKIVREISSHGTKAEARKRVAPVDSFGERSAKRPRVCTGDSKVVTDPLSKRVQPPKVSIACSGESGKSQNNHTAVKSRSEQDTFVQAGSGPRQAVLTGRGKCLVFKRRHVNQLFIRGENVVIVAYSK